MTGAVETASVDWDLFIVNQDFIMDDIPPQIAYINDDIANTKATYKALATPAVTFKVDIVPSIVNAIKVEAFDSTSVTISYDKTKFGLEQQYQITIIGQQDTHIV